MNLPKIITNWLSAQERFDTNDYSQCFTKTATVFDEGKQYQGRNEIKIWNQTANSHYRTVLKPTSFREDDQTAVLTCEVSGNFEGSPIILKFHFVMENDLIYSLKITG